ncbi:hypothetical protein B0H19DRAFT_1088379 [Mycena capillaripes]|nr:hypothetical protein B0H19DRAFT_1088379 [Mycena capillaripes]
MFTGTGNTHIRSRCSIAISSLLTFAAAWQREHTGGFTRQRADPWKDVITAGVDRGRGDDGISHESADGGDQKNDEVHCSNKVGKGSCWSSLHS